MAGSTEGRLSTLDRLITEAEARRIDQMLHIATLLADGESATEAENGLRHIQQLLMRMRAQQRVEQMQLSS
jgi:hypothetical protein